MLQCSFKVLFTSYLSHIQIDALLAGELGYSVCFCITLVKVWRVYYIFHNPKPRKKVRSYIKRKDSSCCCMFKGCPSICLWLKVYSLGSASTDIYMLLNTHVANMCPKEWYHYQPVVNSLQNNHATGFFNLSVLPVSVG